MRPTDEVMLAVRAGRPAASSAGNEASVPPPATASIAPAAKPAPPTSNPSPALTTKVEATLLPEGAPGAGFPPRRTAGSGVVAPPLPATRGRRHYRLSRGFGCRVLRPRPHV